jgi:effector-binding domain-containing protein
MKNIFKIDGNVSDIESNALENEIFKNIPLGKDVKHITEILKEMLKQDKYINLPPTIIFKIRDNYVDLHYRTIAEFFIDFGFVADKILDFKTIKENVFKFPDIIWQMLGFDYNVKELQNYINGGIDLRQLGKPTYKLNEIPETIHNEDDEIIKELLYKKQYLMIIGKPKKANKTRTASSLAISVSKGTSFLNFETRKQRCLCMFLEDTEETAKKRLVYFNNGEEFNDNISIDVNKPNGVFRLRSILQEAQDQGNPFGLVIIDTYSIFTGIREINSYMENILAGLGIKKIAEDFNVGIIALHHANKNKEAEGGDEALGSTSITGSSDGYCILKAVENDNVFEENNPDIKLSIDFILRHDKSPESLIFTIKDGIAQILGTKRGRKNQEYINELIDFIKENYTAETYFSRRDLTENFNKYLMEQKKSPLTNTNIRTITEKLEKNCFLQINNGKGLMWVENKKEDLIDVENSLE